MTVRFAINGLGRIGRALLRIAEQRAGIEVVALNDQTAGETLARLIAHDTLHGRFPGTVTAGDGALVVNGRRIPLHRESEPGRIDWGNRRDGGDRRQGSARGEGQPWLVVESTGRFRSREAAASHLGGSVERVVISATAEGVDATFCVGINERSYDPAQHRVVSNASCTANCLAVVAAVLDRAFGLERGLMNTVHCYTNSQNLVDMAHVDPRRARAAAVNLIPTTTDAVLGLGLVLPELAGRVTGFAVRSPVPAGSLLDLVAEMKRPAPLAELAAAYRSAASNELAGILAVTDEELVSSDFIGDPHSATIDLPLLQQIDHHLLRVVAWYDNEWGYANRLADLISYMGGQGPFGARPPLPGAPA